MRLRHIEVFHAVMQATSISGAAELLNISQPAASKLLAAAERSLGLLLFQRTSGGLKPTQEAQLLFTETKKVHKSLDDVRRLSQNLKTRSGGVLRVGSIPSLGFSIIPDAVSEFLRLYPQASLSIQTHNSEALSDLLLAQELDVAVAFDPPMRPGVLVTELGRARAVYVGGSAGVSPGATMKLEALIGQRWIGPDTTDPLGSKIFAALDAIGHESGTPAIEVKTYYLARELAERGLGVAIVDEFTARAREPNGVLRYVDPRIDVGISVMTAVSSTSSKARDMLISCLAACLPTQTWT
jgi:DNA-binding transcriptional LysR family regulator